MDALASFLYLTNNLPTWVSQVNALGTHVIEKREEFIAEYKRVLAHARPKRKRAPSVISLNTDNRQTSLQSQKDDDTISIPRPADISPLEPANKYLFANARRGRRRLGTSIRSGASGPSTFRNQHQVIIYYDSSLQDSFEKLVKDIGLARNNIRKGKQAKELERGLQLPSFSTRNYARRQREPALTSAPKSCHSLDLTLKTRLLPAAAAAAAASPSDETTSFTSVANDLEAAQSLCESAAHQFLRDGDCTWELDRIRNLLENTMQVARSQIATWELEKEKQKEKEKEKTTQTATAAAAAPAVEHHPRDLAEAANKLAAHIMTPPPPPPPPLLPTNPPAPPPPPEMEVDSDDNSEGDDMVINMSTFRAAARANGRRVCRGEVHA